MIKINLLPPNERPVDRTPLPRFLLIVADAVVGAAVVAYLAYLVLVQVKAVDADLQENRRKLADYAADAREHDRLEAKIQEKLAKIKEIDQVAGRDIVWHEVIDALWTVVARNEHVWFDEIKVLDDRSVQAIVRKNDPQAKQFPPYGLQIKCHAAGLNAQDITRFRMDLKKNATLAAALPVMNFNPDFRATPERDYVEEYSMVFEVVMMPDPNAPAGRSASGRPPTGGTR